MPTELRAPFERPPEPEIPHPHHAAIKQMGEYLAQGKLGEASKLVRWSEASNPDEAAFLERYLKLPQTLDLIERVVCNVLRQSSPHYLDGSFSLIRDLDLPERFYERPNVRMAAIAMAENGLRGNNLPFALEILEESHLMEAGGLALIREDLVLESIAASACQSIKRARELSKLFDRDLTLIPKKFLLDAYVSNIWNFSTDENKLRLFLKEFPQITETDREEAEEAGLDPDFQNSLRQMLASGTDGGYGRNATFTLTEKTLRRESLGAVVFAFSQFSDERDPENYSDPIVWDDEEYERRVMEARKNARRIQERFHLSDEALERAMIDGLSKRHDTTLERIRRAQEALGGSAEFGDRIERACAPSVFRGLMTRSLNKWGDKDNIDVDFKIARNAFPYVTDADIREIYKDAMSSAIASQYDFDFDLVSEFLRSHDMEKIGWNELPAFENDARTLLLGSSPENFENFIRFFEAPASVRARIIADTREVMRPRIFVGESDEYGEYPPRYVQERLTLFDLTWTELPGFENHAKHVLLESGPEEFEELVRAVGAPASERARIIDETREEMRSRIFSYDQNEMGSLSIRFIQERFKLFGFTWEDFTFSDIPLPFLLDATDPELLEHARLNDPWHASLESLKKLQGRSASEEHDPWENELFPLIAALRDDGTVDRESAADGALLVDFVRTFGALNLEKMARVYFHLRREPSASLSEEDRRLVADAIGPKHARLESPHIIHELRKLRPELQRDLLLDKVSRRLGSDLGAEAFHALRGTTRWDRNDGVREIMDTWDATVSAARAETIRLEQEALMALTDGDEEEAARLYGLADVTRERITVGRGYEEATLAVPRVYRSKDGSAGADKEIGRILGRFGTGDDAKKLSPLGDALEILSEAGEGIKKRAERYEATGEAFDDTTHVAQMEASVREESRHPNEIGRLSFEHLARVMPAQWLIHLTREGFPDAEAELRHRAEFLEQYFLEHYLSPAQDPSHTGHAPFSETLRQRIAETWGILEPVGENVLFVTRDRIVAIRKKQAQLSTDTVDVTLVPVRGAGRIFAGDIGDACYSSRHDELARGEYPGLRALLFVTNRSKPTERLAGSVLFVETRTAQGERVLVVRANNPRENLIAQLDAPSLVRQTVDVAIATARRRGVRHVAVVRDWASAASSNRESVSAFYQSEWGNRTPIALVNEPETNFNGYGIWNENSGHPVVVVWTNDDSEAT